MWYSGRYYCQSVVQWAILLLECGTVGEITVSVRCCGRITVRVRYSGRYYCQNVVQWAILLSECGTVGDISVSVWYSGRYYCQGEVRWAILLSGRGTVGDITVRARYGGRYYCQSAVQYAILLSVCYWWVENSVLECGVRNSRHLAGKHYNMRRPILSSVSCLILKAQWYLYIPSGLPLKTHTFCPEHRVVIKW